MSKNTTPVKEAHAPPQASPLEGEDLEIKYLEIQLATSIKNGTYYPYLFIAITLSNGKRISTVISGVDVISIARKLSQVLKLNAVYRLRGE